MKRFKVTQSTNPLYKDRMFEIETRIKNNVTVPFSNAPFRCIMFNGIDVQLVNEREEIRGTVT